MTHAADPEGGQERHGGQGVPEVPHPAEGHEGDRRTRFGRWLPAMPELAKTPFWQNPKDPHLQGYVQQGLLGPTVPDYYVFNPAMAEVRCQHVWSLAMIDVARRAQGERGDRQGVQADRGDLREVPDQEGVRGGHDRRPYRYRPAVRPAAIVVALLARRPQGSEFTWAVAFVVPYIAVFLAFVVYPGVLRAVDGQRAEPCTPSCSPTRSTRTRWSTPCFSSPSA